jgi:hypothetical protein
MLHCFWEPGPCGGFHKDDIASEWQHKVPAVLGGVACGWREHLPEVSQIDFGIGIMGIDSPFTKSTNGVSPKYRITLTAP